jgi:hypothetical protein
MKWAARPSAEVEQGRSGVAEPIKVRCSKSISPPQPGSLNSSASSATDGNLLECNGAALECAHLTRGDVIGKPFWETFWRSVTPTAQEDLRDAILRAARGEPGTTASNTGGKSARNPAEPPRVPDSSDRGQSGRCGTGA